MRKILDTNFTTRPAFTFLAGLSAAFLLAAPSAALAQNRACSVAFSVTNATNLRSFQFNVDYENASDVGEFVSPGECTFATAGLGAVFVDQASNNADVGWTNSAPDPAFAGPGLFATCRFDVPSPASAEPAPADFVVAVEDAFSAPDVPAVPTPTVGVAVSCVEAGSCPSTPMTGCSLSTATGKSKLSFKDNADNTKDQGQYQWKSGAATLLTAFADPTTAGETYSWCVYSNGVLVRGSDVPSGGTCDGKPCWKAAGTTGYQFKGDVEGISQIKLKAGEAGKASVAVKGKSKLGNFSSPDLPLSPNVVSQLIVDNGVTPVCFQSTFTAPSKNDDASYGSKD
jgi:hypothetical protein